MTEIPDQPKPTLKPIWFAVDLLSKSFFEALTNAVLIAALVVASEKYGLKGLQIVIAIGAALMLASMAIKAWQISEVLKLPLGKRGAWLVSGAFSVVLALLLVSALGALAMSTHELVATHPVP